MASLKEIRKAMCLFKKYDIALLHCVSSYPTHEKNINLQTIHELKKEFPSTPIGFSDHTIGFKVAGLAVLAGAKIIEKHFTLNRKSKGPDHFLSADKNTFKSMIDSIKEAEERLGNSGIKCRLCERKTLLFRRKSKI